MPASTVRAPNASVTPANSTALMRAGRTVPGRSRRARRSSSPGRSCRRLRSRSRRPPERSTAGRSQQALCGGVGCLAVVEQQPDRDACCRSVSKAATSEARGSVSFMTASWKRSLRICRPSAAAIKPNTGSVAVTGGAAELAVAGRRSSRSIGCSESRKARRRLLVLVAVRRVALRQFRGQRRGKGRHRRRVVPEVRVGAGLPVHEVRHDDDAAAGRPRGGQQLRHPGIVVGAVAHRDRGVRQKTCHGRAGLEQMRVLVRIAQDAA